jgi:hypothetical protein
MVIGVLWVKELEENVERVRVLLDAIARGEYCCLRHGLPYVTPSLLSSQAFCEYKLDMQLASGRLEVPKPSDARRLVEAILQVRRLIPDEPPASGRLALSVPLAAVVDGVAIVGRPHALIFSPRGLEAIVVGKLASKPSRVYDTDRVKLYAYAVLAEASGFLVPSTAKLVLVSARQPGELVEALRSLESNELRAGVHGGAYVHVLAHDPLMEREVVSELLAYWRGLREPRRRVGPWCSGCPFKEQCMEAAYSSSPLL